MVCGNGHSGSKPFSFVMPAQAAMAGDESVVIERVDTAMFPRDLPEFLVDLLDRGGLTGLLLRIKKSHARTCGEFEGMHDQRGRTAVSKYPDPLAETVGDALHDCGDCFRREVRILVPQVGSEVRRPRGNNYSIRDKTVKGTVRVEKLLRVGVKVAQLDGQVDSMDKGLGPEQRNCGLHGEGSWNC